MNFIFIILSTLAPAHADTDFQPNTWFISGQGDAGYIRAVKPDGSLLVNFETQNTRCGLNSDRVCSQTSDQRSSLYKIKGCSEGVCVKQEIYSNHYGIGERGYVTGINSRGEIAAQFVKGEHVNARSCEITNDGNYRHCVGITVNNVFSTKPTDCAQTSSGKICVNEKVISAGNDIGTVVAVNTANNYLMVKFARGCSGRPCLQKPTEVVAYQKPTSPVVPIEATAVTE